MAETGDDLLGNKLVWVVCKLCLQKTAPHIIIHTCQSGHTHLKLCDHSGVVGCPLCNFRATQSTHVHRVTHDVYIYRGFQAG